MSEDKRILVIDDEPEICNFVKMFLETRGHTVEQSFSGEDGVETARLFQPHVILLDVNMGDGEDGIATLPKILKVVPNARVLMTTGVDDEMMIVRAKQLGSIDYVTKPLVLEDLETNVENQFKALQNE